MPSDTPPSDTNCHPVTSFVLDIEVTDSKGNIIIDHLRYMRPDSAVLRQYGRMLIDQLDEIDPKCDDCRQQAIEDRLMERTYEWVDGTVGHPLKDR